MKNLRLLLIILIALPLVFISCKKEKTADTNKAPVASFSIAPPNGVLSTTFNFDASASSDENEATSELQVRWDWNNDNEWDTEYTTVKTAQHQYQDASEYTVVLEVKDREGWTGKAEKNISVVASGTLNFVTGTYSEITTTSAKFTGEIITVGQAEILQHGHCWSYFENPTIDQDTTELGATAVPGTFVSDLTPLVENLKFHVRAYVSTPNGTVYGNEVVITAESSGNGNPCNGAETVTDLDGNIYHTVVIDNKCWFRENLTTGNMISSSQNQSDNGSIEKYCYNDDEKYCDVFGGLYQWDELMAYAKGGREQGICPDGWRLPTLDELKSLEATFGSGYDILSQGVAVSATNASGFSSLMAGYKSYLPNEFTSFDTETRYWSGEEYLLSQDQAYSLSLDNGGVIQYPTKNKLSAYSVRCIKNE